MATGAWADGKAYDRYMGRWSRPVAAAFLAWLAPPAGLRWLDAGCGTGALTTSILSTVDPARLTAVDASERFAGRARAVAGCPVAGCAVADAGRLPFASQSFDAVVAGLMLNFTAQPAGTVAELARVTAPGGTVAAYVWDYADRMRMLRVFWDVAAQLNPAAAALDEGRRFPLCQPEPLLKLWSAAGLDGVEVAPIEIDTVFADFDDYWNPFLGGQGPAPGYLMSLPDRRRTALREVLRARLPHAPDGSIRLVARAWAVRGRSSE